MGTAFLSPTPTKVTKQPPQSAFFWVQNPCVTFDAPIFKILLSAFLSHSLVAVSLFS